MSKKPKCPLIGQDGNIFNLICEYVEITSTDDEQSEDEDMEMEMM